MGGERKEIGRPTEERNVVLPSQRKEKEWIVGEREKESGMRKVEQRAGRKKFRVGKIRERAQQEKGKSQTRVSYWLKKEE